MFLSYCQTFFSIVLWLLLPSYILASPQDQTAQPLVALYVLAQQNAPEFRQAKADRDSAEQAYVQARAGLLPNINATLSYTDANTGDDVAPNQIGFNPVGEWEQQDTSITLSQPLYNRALWKNLVLQKQRFYLAELEFNLAEQNLILALAEAYLTILAHRDELRFAVAQQRAFAEQLTDAKHRFEVGVLTEVDVKTAQAAHDLAHAEVLAVENNVLAATEMLQAMVGATVLMPALQRKVDLVFPKPDDIDVWVERALSQNTSLLAAEAAYQIGIKDVALQRSGHWPRLDLAASYRESDWNGEQDFEFDTDETRLMLELSIPLFSGGHVLAKTRAAIAQREAAKDNLVAQQRQVRQQTRQAFYTLKSTIARIRALQHAVISSTSAKEAVYAEFKVGKRTSADVLNAERDWLSAQRDYARARYDYFLHKLELERVAGQLQYTDLEIIDHQLRGSEL